MAPSERSGQISAERALPSRYLCVGIFPPTTEIDWNIMESPDQPTALEASIKVTSGEKRPEIYSSPEASSKNGQRNSFAFSPIGRETNIPERAEKKMTLPQTERMFVAASRIESATAAEIFSGCMLKSFGFVSHLFFGRRNTAVIMTERI